MNIEPDHRQLLRTLSHPKLLPLTTPTIHFFLQMTEQGAILSDDEALADDIRKIRLAVPPLEFKDRLLLSSHRDTIRFKDLPDAQEQLRFRGAALLLHPDLAPLTLLLKEVCPTDTAYHLGLLFHLKGGLQLRLDLLSPFEPMISTEDWQQSGRFRGDYLRRWSGGSPRLDMLQDLSPCFASAALATR
jgi:hypothetical protein